MGHTGPHHHPGCWSEHGMQWGLQLHSLRLSSMRANDLPPADRHAWAQRSAKPILFTSATALGSDPGLPAPGACAARLNSTGPSNWTRCLPVLHPARWGQVRVYTKKLSPWSDLHSICCWSHFQASSRAALECSHHWAPPAPQDFPSPGTGAPCPLHTEQHRPACGPANRTPLPVCLTTHVPHGSTCTATTPVLSLLSQAQ